MSKIKKPIAILGSTGSIGRRALAIVRLKPALFNVKILSCNTNYKLMYKQAKSIKPIYVSINSRVGYKFLKENLNPKTTKVVFGMRLLCELIQDIQVELVLVAIVGGAGLLPTVSAISSGKNIALANKETLVVAGKLIMDLSKKNNTSIIPVDSEHSAIFQCLVGEKNKSIEKLIITGSGGPFLDWEKSEFKNIKKQQALQHPNWSMGNKITIDSATLMNKGFELIEAYWLFGVSRKNIEIIIHPQSIIHSLVQFFDGSIKAQMGLPDMTIPILYSFGFPNRISYPFKKFNLADLKDLNFFEPDYNRFPHLKLAYDCLRLGGTSPCILNAANEIAVEAFLNEKISFLNMFKIIEKSLEKSIFVSNPQLDDYLYVDKETRKIATKLISKI